MGKQSTKEQSSSRVIWETLEAFARGRIQIFLQELLEEEITELLGRSRSERRRHVDSASGYRNGYGKERALTMSCGTITVKRPRVRNLEDRFESRVLPLFKRRTDQVGDLLPELYLHGLSLGDFDLALRGLLGEGAPLSASTISRIKEKWQGEWRVWNERSLEDVELVYLWADGIYVKAGLEREKAALLVVIGAQADGRKVVLAVVPGYRESTESWSGVLRDLRRRGLSSPRLIVGDGNLGIWGAARNVYPDAQEQRCWNHKIINVLDKLPKRDHAQALMYLKEIPRSATRKEAERVKNAFVAWCSAHDQERAASCIHRDWDQMTTFYDFPKEHWSHLRTTNIVESPFAALRLRTCASKRFKKVTSASAMIWKMLMVAEQRFRRLKAPQLLRDVYNGDKYENGINLKTLKKDYVA